MKRLWLRLTLAFIAVAVLSAATAALFANQAVGGSFQRYLAQSRLADSGLMEALADHYTRTGSWAGVADAIGTLRGRGVGAGGFGRAEIIVADAAGHIVLPAERAGQALSDEERAYAVPVQTSAGVVGLALFTTPGNAQFSAAASLFLSDLNRVLARAAAFAALLGALAGLAIAQGLSRPLSALASAARRVARGRLDERVRAGGSQEVAEVAAAFNDMTAQLQAADAARRKAESLRRDMVADIAHELRTPLTVIQGNLQAILDDVYPLTKAEVATVVDQTATLRRLVNDLRELSLAEAGQLKLDRAPQPLGALLERAAQGFRDLFEARRLTLTVDVPADLPLARIDGERTLQVINNLLGNALRYTSEGGRVGVRALRSGPGVRVEITDNGPGLSAEDAAHVFDRFWRADKSRARETGGSGLGLAIARQWIEAMDGRIGLETQPGHGSTFWFEVPAQP